MKKEAEHVEVETAEGDLIQIPVANFKSAWGRWCAAQREKLSGGRNGGIRTAESYKKRLKTIAKKAKTKK